MVEMLNRTARPDWLAERNDRRELVLPAPDGFQPEAADQKFKLTLQLKSARIRPGGTLEYRVEFQNVGRKPYIYAENPSFFKGTALFDQGAFRFVLTLPDGSTRTLRPLVKLVSDPGISFRLPGQDLWSKEESQAAAEELSQFGRHSINLAVTLLPGETLYTRPYRKVDFIKEFHRTKGGEIPSEPAPLDFRPLKTDEPISGKGRYQIRVIWELHAPRAPSEEFLAQMIAEGRTRESILRNHRKTVDATPGRVSSEPVSFEVQGW